MKVTEEELQSLQLKPDTKRLAVDLVKANGYVILEEVIPRTLIDHINEQYLRILNPYVEKHHDDIFVNPIDFNKDTHHIRLFLPFEQPFIDPLIIEHPFTTDIVEALLGEDCRLTYFATNTSLPGGKKCQPVHSDYGAVFGELCMTALPIFNLVVNIPLVDTHEDNGPMEIWPGGTHLNPDYTYGPKGFNIKQLAPHMQSLKVSMPAGSILIRDIRMWHRGTPNRSDQPRPNIAMIYEYGKGGPGSGSIRIPHETYNNLSERAKKLLRFEKIGSPVIEPYH